MTFIIYYLKYYSFNRIFVKQMDFSPYWAYDVLFNTYWTNPSPLSKISMLKREIVNDGEAGVHYFYSAY